MIVALAGRSEVGVSRASGGRAMVKLVVYPGAHHGFDIADLRFDSGIQNKSHRLEYNEATSRDAIERVRSFLQQRLSLEAQKRERSITASSPGSTPYTAAPRRLSRSIHPEFAVHLCLAWTQSAEWQSLHRRFATAPILSDRWRLGSRCSLTSNRLGTYRVTACSGSGDGDGYD